MSAQDRFRSQKLLPVRRQRIRKRQWLLFFLVLLALWLGYKQVRGYFVRPEAILVLGGSQERERFAAQVAKTHPELSVWVSSGSPKWYVEKVFTNAGIERDRLHLDYRALDTVTNFTTLVDDFKAQGIDSVYLVTSENHMRRARLIGEIVFGSRGITLKPLSVPSTYPPEPVEKSLRDTLRALLWVATGRTGATFGSRLEERVLWLRSRQHQEVLVRVRKVEQSEH